MNSIYKKIALVCVISMAANQAVHAFQFPNVWNLIKGNPKTTAAVVASIAALIVLLVPSYKMLKKRQVISSFKKKQSNVQTHIYVSGDPIDSTLSKRLDVLTQVPQEGSIVGLLNNNKNCYVVTVSNKGQENNPLACLVTEEHKDQILIKHMGMDKGRGLTALLSKATSEDLAKQLLKLSLETKKEIALSMKHDAGMRDSIEKQITAFDGIKPKYENGVFKRNVRAADVKSPRETVSHEPARPAYVEQHLHLVE